MNLSDLSEIRNRIREQQIEAIVIGASAGAVEALSAILPALPAETPYVVMIVVHIPPDRECILTNLFRQKCNVPVTEAEDKEPLTPGTIFFAPPNYHLLVEANHILSLSNEEPVLYSRPSIDVLFQSAADVYGSRLMAIVLSGANNDGTAGLATVIAEEGIGIVQHPAQAEASYMPLSAINSCPSAYVLKLEEICQLLKT